MLSCVKRSQQGEEEEEEADEGCYSRGCSQVRSEVRGGRWEVTITTLGEAGLTPGTMPGWRPRDLWSG